MQDFTTKVRHTTWCDGWWEQYGIGREPMDDLCLSFEGRYIDGTGVDIVGPFNFRGTMDENGIVTMRKQYLGKHSLDYVGHYDGEGVLSGEWLLLLTIAGSSAGLDDCAHEVTVLNHGRWWIRIKSLVGQGDSDIQEIVPAMPALCP
jgi:hypothetical protein